MCIQKVSSEGFSSDNVLFLWGFFFGGGGEERIQRTQLGLVSGPSAKHHKDSFSLVGR